jgi:hypothetical protein
MTILWLIEEELLALPALASSSRLVIEQQAEALAISSRLVVEPELCEGAGSGDAV